MENAESKKRVTLLKANLEALGERLKDAHLHINGVLQQIDNPEFDAGIKAIPTSDDVLKATSDYKTELKRSKELAARVASLI
jgi:hypothetical protein